MSQVVNQTHLAALIAGPNAAIAVFDYAAAGLNATVGQGLMTASVYDLPNMRSRRVFTENAQAYPVGNFKTLDRNRYFETVILGRRPFASTTIAEIAGVFFDWEKIQGLGFESNLNLPAIADDRVIGTVNLLGPAGRFDGLTVAAAMAWQPVVTTAFLLLHLAGEETETFHANHRPQDLPTTEDAHP